MRTEGNGLQNSKIGKSRLHNSEPRRFSLATYKKTGLSFACHSFLGPSLPRFAPSPFSAPSLFRPLSSISFPRLKVHEMVSVCTEQQALLNGYLFVMFIVFCRSGNTMTRRLYFLEAWRVATSSQNNLGPFSTSTPISYTRVPTVCVYLKRKSQVTCFWQKNYLFSTTPVFVQSVGREYLGPGQIYQ